MAVRKNYRKETKCQAVIEARHLASQIINDTKNENIFPAEYRWGITDEIVKCAMRIYTNSWGANLVWVGNDPEKASERLRLQEKAIRGCDIFLGYIQLAQEVFHFRAKKVRHWTELTINAQSALRKWHKADKQLYK